MPNRARSTNDGEVQSADCENTNCQTAKCEVQTAKRTVGNVAIANFDLREYTNVQTDVNGNRPMLMNILITRDVIAGCSGKCIAEIARPPSFARRAQYRIFLFRERSVIPKSSAGLTSGCRVGLRHCYTPRRLPSFSDLHFFGLGNLELNMVAMCYEMSFGSTQPEPVSYGRSYLRTTDRASKHRYTQHS